MTRNRYRLYLKDNFMGITIYASRYEFTGNTTNELVIFYGPDYEYPECEAMVACTGTFSLEKIELADGPHPYRVLWSSNEKYIPVE